MVKQDAREGAVDAVVEDVPVLAVAHLFADDAGNQVGCGAAQGPAGSASRSVSGKRSSSSSRIWLSMVSQPKLLPSSRMKIVGLGNLDLRAIWLSSVLFEKWRIQ